MRVTIGRPAPAFVAQTSEGRMLELASLRGKKVWLAFFRHAACPLCNLRVHHIIRRWDAIEAAALEVVGVFQSPPQRIERYVARQRPPFPLVSDPKEALYALYGVEASLAGYLDPRNLAELGESTRLGFASTATDGTATRLPADFLIDAEGIVRDAFYADRTAEHIPFERVERFVGAPLPPR